MSSPAPAPRVLRSLESLVRIHAEVTAIEPARFELTSDPAELRRELVEPILRCLKAALLAFTELDDAITASGAETQRSLDILLDDDGEPSGVAESHELALAMGWRDVSDATFAARLEIKNVVDRLRPEMASFEGLLVAAEGARRKLRRALAHVLELSARLGAIPRALLPSSQDDLEIALATRRLFTDLRASLVWPKSHTIEELRRGIGSAARGLTRMFASMDAKYVRLRDQTLLEQLHGRILRWMQFGSGREALELWSEITTTFDLLGGINQRQELVQHDNTALVRGVDPATPDDVVLGQLRRLYGLDAELDLAICELGTADATGLAARARARLRELAEARGLLDAPSYPGL